MDAAEKLTSAELQKLREQWEHEQALQEFREETCRINAQQRINDKMWKAALEYRAAMGWD